VPDGGWHFSYLGGPNRVIEKIKAFAHTEVLQPGLLDETRIKMVIESGQDLYGRDFKFEFVNLDVSFPRCVVNNIDKWKHLIWFRDLVGKAGA
jgi:beta-1,4-mannosyl-glycoprotein beta-1,4-N-acetylglucosaminyltransferase